MSGIARTRFEIPDLRRLDALGIAESIARDAASDVGSANVPVRIESLEYAIRVFEANDRSSRAAFCWQILAKRHFISGSNQVALECARRAIGIEEIDIDTRLSLTGVVVPTLCALLRLTEARSTMETDFLPYMRSADLGPLLASAWVDMSQLHIVAAIRSARLRSPLSLDLDGTSSCRSVRMADLMKADIAQSRSCLERAREVDCGVAGIDSAKDVLHALEGDVDEVAPDRGGHAAKGSSEMSRLCNLGWALRINDRYAAAIPHLQKAFVMAREAEAGLFERLASYELAVCHEALGNLEAALSAHATFSVLDARARIPSVRARMPRDDARPPDVRAVTHRAQDFDASVMHLRRTVPPYIAKARRLIVESISDRLSLADVAARVGTSSRSLQAGFSRYDGVTFTAAYRHAAMREATRLLRMTVMTIGDVARRVGYQSTSSFSRDFRKFAGLAPKDFRSANTLQIGQHDNFDF